MIKDIKREVGLDGGDSDLRWAYFADVRWGWAETVATNRVFVGSISLRVALADASCVSYITEENFWNT